jgi:2-C-methyl-D-erythritol 2,4-cyclodiphosphate synthase
MRVGIGYDVHRLVKGRKLILGGITVPFEKGLFGHSDADVLTHAVCDALLGAAGSGDIGQHFPDTDPEFKDISSIKLLRQTFRIIRARQYRVLNIDATIMAEEPKLLPYLKSMQQNIANAIDTASTNVNIKATTTEGIGMIGKGEGIAAICVVLIERPH